MREERCATNGTVYPRRMNEIFIPACRGDETDVYSVLFYHAVLLVGTLSCPFTTPHVFSLIRCPVLSEFSYLTATSLYVPSLSFFLFFFFIIFDGGAKRK